MARFPISEWGGVCCSNEVDRAAIRSWFGGIVDDDWTPLKADILTHCETDRTLKIRALFRRPDGQLREAIRTMGGKHFTIHIRPPGSAILKGFRAGSAKRDEADAA